tara:strand:- start:1415 stop:1615 length:201 start_codon:yes stop_codon:yes gene_type:complete
MERQINIVELKQGGDCDTITIELDDKKEITITNFDDEIFIYVNDVIFNDKGFRVKKLLDNFMEIYK